MFLHLAVGICKDLFINIILTIMGCVARCRSIASQAHRAFLTGIYQVCVFLHEAVPGLLQLS